MKPVHRLRQAVNVINLSTPLGLLLAAIAARPVRDPGSGSGDRAGPPGLCHGPGGLLVAGGYRLPIPPAPVFTVGNVILCRGDAPALLHRPRLMRHEGRHSTQYAYCLGPVMIPLYLLGAGASLVLCGDHSSYNPFERLAGLTDGGYEKRPLRFSRRRGQRNPRRPGGAD